MPTIYCQLGSTPALSIAELHARVEPISVEQLSSYLAQVVLPESVKPQAFFDTLGGTIKFFSPIAHLSAETASSEEIQAILLDALLQKEGKITYGLAELGRDHLPPLDPVVFKTMLKERGISARYVDGSRSGLSASILLHKKSVLEFLVATTNNGVVIAKTEGVQNIDEWSIRDREKPYADRRKGMLPPKVARILVNLGVAGKSDLSNVRVYDPYCGTGTILAEAVMLGAEVVGSDIDPASVVGSQKNIEWLAKEYNLDVKSEWILGDVAHAKPRFPVDVIVTEPFLGKQTPRTDQLPGIFKGLDRLYLGGFKQWQHILKEQGKVVMILPRVTTPHQTFRCQALIDKLPGLGYTTLSGPIMYSRPQAIVEREVWVFEYSGTQK